MLCHAYMPCQNKYTQAFRYYLAQSASSTIDSLMLIACQAWNRSLPDRSIVNSHGFFKDIERMLKTLSKSTSRAIKPISS
jgi:hypothetical protein